MRTIDRLKREQAFHDAQAANRAPTFSREPARLRFADAEYLDHEPWIRPAMAQLGPLGDRRVLDWGCGHGMAAVVMARRGARVTACDISAGYLREARRRAAANQLPFRSSAFDVVWGHAILHHLDVAVAAAELRRVLHPDGVAVLCEPWDGNPIVRLARRWFAKSDKHTADERPLAARDLQLLRSKFTSVAVTAFHFGRYLVIVLRP
jgi:SAM-dependent methyltransferase